MPVKGKYGLMVVFEGEARLYYSGSDVDVRKAFPAVDFYDEKTGQRYTLKGEVIPPKPPKPPNRRREKERKARNGDRTTARASTRHREGS